MVGVVFINRGAYINGIGAGRHGVINLENVGPCPIVISGGLPGWFEEKLLANSEDVISVHWYKTATHNLRDLIMYHLFIFISCSYSRLVSLLCYQK